MVLSASHDFELYVWTMMVLGAFGHKRATAIQRLQSSSFLVMTYSRLRDDILLPKKGTTFEPLGVLDLPQT